MTQFRPFICCGAVILCLVWGSSLAPPIPSTVLAAPEWRQATGDQTPAQDGKQDQPGQAGQENPLVAPPAAIAEFQELIDQLGSADFEQREQASLTLLESGRDVLPQLREATSSDDLEVALRSERIIAAIEARIMHERRVAFLKATDSDQVTLAGWQEFREVTGESSKAREFFLAMYEAEPELMEALGADEARQKKLLALRSEQLVTSAQQQRRTSTRNRMISSTHVAALFFVSSMRTDHERTAVQRITQLLNYSDMRTQLAGARQRDVLHALLTHFIKVQLTAKGNDVSYHAASMLPLALTYNVDGVLPIAVELLEQSARDADAGIDRATRNATADMYAAITVGRFGDKSHVELLTKHISDDRSCWSWHVQNEVRHTQVGDVALVMSLHLLGQDAANYNFDRLSKASDKVYQPYTISFIDEEQRKISRDAWKKFRETGVAPEPPEPSQDKVSKPAPVNPGPPPMDPPAKQGGDGKEVVDKQAGDKQDAGKQTAKPKDAPPKSNAAQRGQNDCQLPMLEKAGGAAMRSGSSRTRRNGVSSLGIFAFPDVLPLA